jgi:hypothetical protein
MLNAHTVDHVGDQPILAGDDQELEQLILAEALGQHRPQLV